MGKKLKNPFDNPDFMYEAFDRVRYAREIAKINHRADQIPEENQIDFKSGNGFFMGMQPPPYSSKYVGKPHDGDGHVFIDGTPGSGKTSAIVIPTMATWTDRQIIFDIKGNLARHWYDFNRGTGKKLKVFSPMNSYTARFDPFSLLRKDPDNIVPNANALALALLPSTPGDRENQIWLDLARNVLTGVILHYFALGATFTDTMLIVQANTIGQLVHEIFDDYSEDSDTVSIAQLYFSKLRGMKPEIQAGIAMDHAKLIPLAVDKRIMKAFTVEAEADIIDWADFNSNDDVYDVILEIPEDKLEQWSPMVTLMLNQLVTSLERRQDKYSLKGSMLDSVLIMLDEFPRLGTCHAIRNGLATLRNRGVTFALFVQSLAQLDARYGEYGRKEILGLCTYKVLLGVSEPDEQEYFSRMIGTTRDVTASISTTLAPFSTLSSSQPYSVTLNETRQPILEPHMLGRLQDELLLIGPWGVSYLKKMAGYSPKFRELVRPEWARETQMKKLLRSPNLRSEDILGGYQYG